MYSMYDTHEIPRSHFSFRINTKVLVTDFSRVKRRCLPKNSNSLLCPETHTRQTNQSSGLRATSESREPFFVRATQHRHKHSSSFFQETPRQSQESVFRKTQSIEFLNSFPSPHIQLLVFSQIEKTDSKHNKTTFFHYPIPSKILQSLTLDESTFRFSKRKRKILLSTFKRKRNKSCLELSTFRD